MYRKYLDLIIVLMLSIIGCIAATTSTVDELRVVFTLPLALVLPGYALTEAMIAKRSMEFPEKLAFILGLSLAVDILGGLVLNLTPWGLQTSSWVILLGGITIGAVFAAMVQRQHDPTIYKLRFTLDVRNGLLFGLAVAIAFAALAVASLGALRQPTQAFTQFWLLPVEGTNGNRVQLGIFNMETTKISYRAELRIGDIVIQDWTPIELQSGEKWIVESALPEKQSETEVVVAVLYRLDSPNKIYRRVTLWRTQ